MAFLQFPSPTQLRNISDPSANTDAATKGYVDAAIGGGDGNITAQNITANVGNITTITTTTFTSNGTANFSGNINLTGSVVNLGPVGNIVITGGSSGYILQTDGTGNLSWVNPSSSQPSLDGVVDEFNGNGSQVNFTLSTTPKNKNVTFVAVQGIMQPKSSYSVSGNILTFSQAPPNGALVEITTMVVG